MMKSYWFLLFLLAAAPFYAIDGWIEGKAGYFFPTDKTFRKIYSGGGIYGLEGTCQIYSELYGWVSGSYFSKEGKSIGEGNPTKIYFVPVGFGLKHYNYLWKWDFGELGINVAAGALCTYVHMRNSSPFVAPEQFKWGYGGIVKAGFLFTYGHFIADLYGDYSYLKLTFPNSSNPVAWGGTSNLSGFSLGAGVGVWF